MSQSASLVSLKVPSASSSLRVFKVRFSKDKIIDENHFLRESTRNDISFNSTNILSPSLCAGERVGNRT
jgi:hypothetical protein